MAIVHSAGFRARVYEESPWYWPIAPWLARFSGLARFPSHDELSALYRERSDALGLPPLRFVPSSKSKKRRARGKPIELWQLYEGRIVERGEVPTRPDDWHDLFNALAFVTFPRAKRALHGRQYAIAKARLTPGATRLPNARTREQDALALFDEGGLCAVASPDTAPQLREGDDDALRDALAAGTVRLVPFGHALHEHLVAALPCPLATVHVVPLAPLRRTDAQLLDEVDRALAAALADPRAFREPSGARGSSLAGLAEGLGRPAATP